LGSTVVDVGQVTTAANILTHWPWCEITRNKCGLTASRPSIRFRDVKPLSLAQAPWIYLLAVRNIGYRVCIEYMQVRITYCRCNNEVYLLFWTYYKLGCSAALVFEHILLWNFNAWYRILATTEFRWNYSL
jgi:hypothetical protein